MKKKTCLILLIAAVMMLSGCTLVVKDPEVDAKRVIIDVNGETVDKRAFINIYNNALNEEYATQQMYKQFGMIQSINIDPDQVMQATLDGLVRRMVLLQKAKELKLDELTEEETAELVAATDASWQESLDRIKRTDMADTELEGDELTAALEEKAVEYGITREVVEQSEREQMLLKKIRALATEDSAVTDEAIQADFDAKVEAAKAEYEGSPDAFGSAVNASRTVYYRPAGYRYIKQVLVKFLADDQAVIDEALKALTTAKQELTAAQSDKSLNDTALAQDGQSEADIALLQEKAEELDAKVAAAQEKVDQAEQKLNEEKEKGYANIFEKATDICTRAKDGEDFDALVEEYNEDKGMPETGYAVREGFASFDAAFVTPAMALENPGDVAEPSKGDYGYYIVQYAAAIDEGPMPLADVREGIHDELLAAKQEEDFTAATDAWVAESNVQTYIERVND
ncbi:MAG: SurA N-terminal domain-containing protein [Christensenellales bacterium]|jgi:hypothetical protein